MLLQSCITKREHWLDGYRDKQGFIHVILYGARRMNHGDGESLLTNHITLTVKIVAEILYLSQSQRLSLSLTNAGRCFIPKTLTTDW